MMHYYEIGVYVCGHIPNDIINSTKCCGPVMNITWFPGKGHIEEYDHILSESEAAEIAKRRYDYLLRHEPPFSQLIDLGCTLIVRVGQIIPVAEFKTPSAN